MAKLKHKTEIEVSEQKRESKIQQATRECARRIESQWDAHGQLNAALGIYSKEEQKECKDVSKHHRKCLKSLTKEISKSDDPNAIDVTDDQWWE
jgi:hypothetical protein